MSKPKIAIIVGSTRANRFADKPTEWIAKIAKARGDIDVEIVDLRDYPMPFFDEVGLARLGAVDRTKSRSAGRRRSPNSTASSSPPPNTITARPPC